MYKFLLLAVICSITSSRLHIFGIRVLQYFHANCYFIPLVLNLLYHLIQRNRNSYKNLRIRPLKHILVVQLRYTNFQTDNRQRDGTAPLVPVPSTTLRYSLFTPPTWTRQNCLMLSAVVFTPPRRTRQDNFVLSASAV